MLCALYREAGLLCLPDLAPVLVKLFDIKSCYQVFIITGHPTPLVMVLSVMFSSSTGKQVFAFKQMVKQSAV